MNHSTTSAFGAAEERSIGALALGRVHTGVRCNM